MAQHTVVMQGGGPHGKPLCCGCPAVPPGIPVTGKPVGRELLPVSSLWGLPQLRTAALPFPGPPVSNDLSLSPSWDNFGGCPSPRTPFRLSLLEAALQPSASFYPVLLPCFLQQVLIPGVLPNKHPTCQSLPISEGVSRGTQPRAHLLAHLFSPKL